MKFQAFHVNPGEKLKKKDVNNDLSNFMSVFPNSEGWGVFFLANVNKKRVMIALLGYIDLIIGLTKNRSLLSSA